MRYMRLIRSRMYQRPLVARICCAASMVSSLSPCVYFVLATAIWPAGALGGGLFVYADRVTQVKRGVRGKPGGLTFSTPLVALKAQASYPDACHKSFQGGAGRWSVRRGLRWGSSALRAQPIVE